MDEKLRNEPLQSVGKRKEMNETEPILSLPLLCLKGESVNSLSLQRMNLNLLILERGQNKKK